MLELAQIEFQNVSYSSEEKSILRNISIQIQTGDYISVMGPSGSGKSTFLKLICHLISPSEGKVLFSGSDMMQRDPVELRKTISYCFQNPVLFGNTVEDNFLFIYSIRKQKADWKRINSLLLQFHMEPDCLKHDVQSLSGGEKQRIALIRTLLFRPEVLLLDEVTSALDVENTQIVEQAVEKMNHDGITVIWVTHNPEQGKKQAGKLLTIENGQIKSLEVLK